MTRCFVLLSVFALVPAPAHADGPADNSLDKVRRIPPPGIVVPEKDARELEAGLAKLASNIEAIKREQKGQVLDLLPDVEIYEKAVRWALKYHEFFNVREIGVAKSLLEEGSKRAEALRSGEHSWTSATGLVVRAYRSKIDGSIQPYGLVVPNSYRPDFPVRYRLDLWFHGRGETLSELNFIEGRRHSAGEFTPRDAIVLHLYGRYCNANKFAGEIDCLEALNHVRRHYRIDDNRIVVRGFSMGGAACWQFAVHYADKWAAAAPGAGFAETPDFLKVFQQEDLKPADYERKLWHLYDCTDYAGNLFNCPTVAYSGEIDKQKQAADVMAKAMELEGLPLTHVIGPKTAHSYHPQAKEEINRRIDGIVARGRDSLPWHVRLTTWTLRYNEMFWLFVEGLDKHWERVHVEAWLGNAGRIEIRLTNVSALTLSIPPGLAPLDYTPRTLVTINGQIIVAPAAASDRSWIAHFRHTSRRWERVNSLEDGTLRKRHGLQGPIDDAFMDSFLMVRPTGTPQNDKVHSWVQGEMAHAVEHWRRQFRGDAPIKDDSAVTDADIAANNLVLWGDPQTNKVLGRIQSLFPGFRWDKTELQLGPKHYNASQHVPVLIYPNPLNPRRYIVLNSGFTYREYDYLNNARQVPKLPDYAVIDVNVPADARRPGGIVMAGFFDEHWQLPSESR
jgi:pimeloyl-ACP methyl ester carboxylesterase